MKKKIANINTETAIKFQQHERNDHFLNMKH